MRTETGLELKYFHSTNLEMVEICLADHEIKIKMFAYSKECICDKRHTYGTIDGETHTPVAILDGRDGLLLKNGCSTISRSRQ